MRIPYKGDDSLAKTTMKAILLLVLCVVIVVLFCSYFRHEGVCLRNGYERVIYYRGDPYCLGEAGEPTIVSLKGFLDETAP
jgi:hypothetical protein